MTETDQETAEPSERKRNGVPFSTADGWVRLYWQHSTASPAIIRIGKGDHSAMYGLSADQLRELHAALVLMVAAL